MSAGGAAVPGTTGGGEVLSWGDPAASRCLVALHGFMATGQAWDSLARTLGADGWRVLAPTLMPTDEAEAGFDALAAAVHKCVLEAAGQGAAPVLLGYSMGGRIALEYLQRFPEAPISGLVLESAGLGPRDGAEREALRERSRQWAARFRSEPAEDYVAWWETLGIFATQAEMPPQRRAAQRRMRLSVPGEALAALTIAAGQGRMHGGAENAELLSALSGRIPVLYFAGSRDVKYAQIAASLAGSGVQVRMAATGHNIHLEDPDFLRNALEAIEETAAKGDR